MQHSASVKARMRQVVATATMIELDSEAVAMLATEVSAKETGHEAASSTSETSEGRVEEQVRQIV